MDNEVFEKRPAVLTLGADTVLKQGYGQRLPGMKRHPVPASERLFPIIRALFRELVPDDQRFMALFDRFEYLMCLVDTDICRESTGYSRYTGPTGQFAWRYRRNKDQGPAGIVAAEIAATGQDWPALQAGLFHGDLARLQEVKMAYDEDLGRVSRG